LNAMILRYFNVAGADPLGRGGQCSKKATHLIKIACEAAVGKRDKVEVYGDDYPTPDGTCLRDYIHVSDLADAHVAALRRLDAGGPGETLNCGYGQGYSVREVLAAVERAANRNLNIVAAPRRAGDPPALAAAADRIRAVLDWRPQYEDLDLIVAHALAWERKLAAENA
jgi:UDP-glucose 4-epimerase